MVVLYLLLRATLFRPHVEIDLTFQRRMLRASYPLMINLLLAIPHGGLGMSAIFEDLVEISNNHEFKFNFILKSGK